MSITFDRKLNLYVVARRTKLARTFKLFASARAYADAMTDLRKAGLL